MARANARTHARTPVCDYEDVTVLWNQGVCTKKEVTANRPNIIIKKQKRENTHTDKCGSTSGQKCHATGSRKQTKIQAFMYRNTRNLEHEMYDYTGNNWTHRSSNKMFKEKFGKHTTETFNIFTKKTVSYTWNITSNTESAAV
jgi:hypothetical protein